MSSLEEIELFRKLIDENRYCYEKLVYIVFPFGQKGHELEFKAPYDWQIAEWQKMSAHFNNPLTRDDTYRLGISSGNGSAKTAFGAMTIIMVMYTHQLKARLTANTDPQMKTVVWPEYDIWFRHARFNEIFFEKFGTSIKARNEKLADTWRIDTVTWSETSPAGISGLHNKGRAVAYVFEEAPGIPAIVYEYARGAFVDTDTFKLHLAFGNSDDPNSKFEQNMSSPQWNSLRIDTRTLPYINKKEIAGILEECGGDEDADDFRVRVRGLPRKTAKDSIIRLEDVQAALARAKDFDTKSVEILPSILACDPAWRGGDECTIWWRQGHYYEMLEKYKLDGSAGETHQLTYLKLCHWEREKKADAVFIDQGEGTAIYTLAVNAGKSSWELVAFAGQPNDFPEAKDSEYGNIRAQMYYTFAKAVKGAVLASRDPAWIPAIEKQLPWTQGTRHKVTGKKMCEAKLEIKARIGFSPDVSDGVILTHARDVFERLPENDGTSSEDRFQIGGDAYKMPAHEPSYEIMDADYQDIYD